MFQLGYEKQRTERRLRGKEFAISKTGRERARSTTVQIFEQQVLTSGQSLRQENLLRNTFLPRCLLFYMRQGTRFWVSDNEGRICRGRKKIDPEDFVLFWELTTERRLSEVHHWVRHIRM